MEIYKIENLTFRYPGKDVLALSGIDFSIKKGQFITICGKSGCGKTTLLRLLKTTLTPAGDIDGAIFYDEVPISDVDIKRQVSEIGFVLQNPDNQIVADKVWHELAFGLESLSYKTEEIHTRVAEMASFFGIQTWFHKKVTELSGGQKQLLNLASVMVMQPAVLILDEPTSQLDPIAAHEFLKAVEKINRELGITVIMTEHRLEETFAVSDRIVVMNDGKIIVDSTPADVGKVLRNKADIMFNAMPTPIRVYNTVECGQNCPVTVREGRIWLENFAAENKLFVNKIPVAAEMQKEAETAIEIKDAWFRYEKNMPDVIRGMNLSVKQSEIFAVVGGNGTGKTTALSLISGVNRPHTGKVLINGVDIKKQKNLYDGLLGVMPQNPQTLFTQKTVLLDLMEVFADTELSVEEKNKKVLLTAKNCEIENLMDSHPYDLSGGEQQRVALAKVLLKNPSILLMDEPTKGMDFGFKMRFGAILKKLTENGVTVVIVSHDIEFCAKYADMCAMVFDGKITSQGVPRSFFSDKSFYTTSANRMARGIIPQAILDEDIILACGKEIINTSVSYPKIQIKPNKKPQEINKNDVMNKKISFRCVLGIVFAILLCITITIAAITDYTEPLNTVVTTLIISETIAMLFCFCKRRKNYAYTYVTRKKQIRPKSVLLSLVILVSVIITVLVGVYWLDGRKYYFISLMVILETLIPFFISFEQKNHRAREIVIISVLCAIAVSGRTAFFMVPQFKPVIAVVIISAVSFGKDTGFLVGTVTGFVSNFFFGQGPWTPWQMISFGVVGFVAGVFSETGIIAKKRLHLCVLGALVTLIVYGGIMNPASIIMYQKNPTWEMIVSAYAVGLPLDAIHAMSTALFLWFISEPMIEKLERIKTKYNI